MSDLLGGPIVHLLQEKTVTGFGGLPFSTWAITCGAAIEGADRRLRSQDPDLCSCAKCAKMATGLGEDQVRQMNLNVARRLGKAPIKSGRKYRTASGE